MKQLYKGASAFYCPKKSIKPLLAVSIALAASSSGSAFARNDLGGSGISVTGDGNSAYGYNVKIKGNNSAAWGMDIEVDADNSITLGIGSTNNRDNTVSFGTADNNRQLTNVAAGTEATDGVNMQQMRDADDAILNRVTTIDGRVTNVEGDITGLQQDALLWNATANAFSANHGGTGPNKITNVAAGVLSDTSTDAVNGSQLKATNDAVAGIDGRVTTIEGGINNVDNRVTTFSSRVTNVDSRVMGLEGDALLWDVDTGAFSAMHGVDGPNKITNIAAGELSDTSTEAVNGSQLKATNDAVTTVDNRVTNLGDQVTTIDGRVTNVEGSIITIGDQVTGLANDALLWDAGIGAFSAKHGGAGLQKITNVAAGVLSNTSSDAVNGSQLKATNDAVTTVDGRVTNVEGSIITIGDQVTGLANDALLWDAGIGAFSAKHGGAGPQKITNIAAGVLSDTSTDAVNGAQLKATNDAVTVIDGRVTTIEGSITNIANGGGIKYFHTRSAKDDSQATGTNSVAAGPAAIANGASSVAMGDEAKATADKATAVGANAMASGTGASAFGNNAKAEGNGSLAMGDGAKATKEKSTAIGSGAAASAMNAVALGADSVADRDNSVSVGSVGSERQITNVKAGKEDTDAVNVAQLNEVSGSVTNIDKRVGDVDNRVAKVEGDVTHIQNGTDGMFQVSNTSNLPKPKATGRDSVAGGAGAEASGANSMAIGTSAKASGENSVAVGANSVADRANTVAVGSAGNERQITSVAAGVEDTDAVNVAQLNQSVSGITGNANAYTDSRYASLKNDLHEQDNVLSAGIAGALAQASLPQPYVPGASMAAAGVGNYRGQSAVAVGVSRISDNGKWVTKLQGSADTQGNVGVSAGVGYQW